MPRMLMLLLPGWLVWVMVNEVVIFTRSSKSRTFARSSLGAVATNTDDGTSWTFSARLPPVTTISSTVAGAEASVRDGAAVCAEATRAPNVRAQAATDHRNSDLKIINFLPVPALVGFSHSGVLMRRYTPVSP